MRNANSAKMLNWDPQDGGTTEMDGSTESIKKDPKYFDILHSGHSGNEGR